MNDTPELPPPATRSECLPGGTNDARPCRRICRYRLEEDQEGSSCLLDAADRGGMTLEEVSQILGVTRERVRQIEEMALIKLKRKQTLDPFRD